MKRIAIKDIKEKDQVSGTFLVTRKEMGISKTGKPYLNLKVMDSTGELEARVWEDAQSLSANFQKNDVVTIKGYAVAYQGGVQININSINTVPEGAYSIKDFLPCSKRETSEMMAELDSVIGAVKDRHIKALLTSIFSDPGIRGRFAIAPAAKSMHHPYLGGLVEHVLSMCGLVGKIASHYGTAVNKDLLIAGAILHDIGKIYELSYNRAFEYTDEGRLLGHITMGVELIEDNIRRCPGFPAETSVLLKHMILSHHGHMEFGSPKRPKTIEAIILYYIDDLDAKVTAVRSLIEEGADSGAWTPYQRLFERYIFKGYPARDEEEKPCDGAGPADKGPLTLFK